MSSPLPGSLDFDDIGAEIAEHHRAIRAGHHPGQIDNANAVQREPRCSFGHGTWVLSVGDKCGFRQRPSVDPGREDREEPIMGMHSRHARSRASNCPGMARCACPTWPQDPVLTVLRSTVTLRSCEEGEVERMSQPDGRQISPLQELAELRRESRSGRFVTTLAKDCCPAGRRRAAKPLHPIACDSAYRPSGCSRTGICRSGRFGGTGRDSITRTIDRLISELDGGETEELADMHEPAAAPASAVPRHRRAGISDRCSTELRCAHARLYRLRALARHLPLPRNPGRTSRSNALRRTRRGRALAADCRGGRGGVAGP